MVYLSDKQRVKANASFRLGDSVRLNYKALPVHIIKLVMRKRTRTIKRIRYDYGEQHLIYYLGFNNKDDNQLSSYGFRANQLIKAKGVHDIGRPRSKRKYTRRKGVK